MDPGSGALDKTALAPVVKSIRIADATAKATIGEERTERIKSEGTSAFALIGFTPFAPYLWGVQVPLFILFTILFIYVGLGWWSPVLGWISQGIVLFVLLKFYTKFLFKFGIGI